MRRWLLIALDDVGFPILLAFSLAAMGTIPFAEGAVFFSAAEICCTLFRRYAPLPSITSHILGPLAAPIPAFLLVWALFPDADLLVMGTMVGHYFIYLGYAAVMVFFLPFLEALLGLPQRFDDDTP